jgi:hypothetical protein
MKPPPTLDDIKRELRERIEAAREFSPGSPLRRAHLGTSRTILTGFLRNTPVRETLIYSAVRSSSRVAQAL